MARKMETTAVDLTHSSSTPWIADVYSIATNASRVNLTNTRTGYIGEFEEIDDHRNGKVVVQLNGRLNKTGVISPRYNVALSDMEKWVVKLLPSRQFGYIVLTTSSGIMDHEEARRKHVSGKIIGFFY
jgi:ribosomal protein S8